MAQNVKDKILVVDDEQAVCEMLSLNFKDKYEVDTAGNVSEASKKIKSGKYALVITDINMPGGSGLDVLRSVKSESPETITLVITGFGSVEGAVEALKLGAEEYLQKPIDLDRLNVTVKNAVEKYRLSLQLKKIEMLFELEKASGAVMEAESIEKSLPNILKMLIGMFRADGASVLLFDKNNEQLVVSAAEGLGNKTEPLTTIRSGGKIRDWLVENDRVLILDPLSSKGKEIFKDLEFHDAIRSSLLVPLAISGKTLGLLNLNMVSALKNFTEQDLDIAGIFSISLALSIENNRFRRELIEKNERLKKIDILKTELISKMYHEFRTPLSVMMESVNIVADGSCGKVNEEQKDFLDMAARNVERLVRLINEALFSEKKEGGEEKFEMKEYDINELVAASLEMITPVAEKSGLTLESRPGPGLPKIKFNTDRITQVLINLLNNAIKFTHAGKITLTTEKDGGYVKVSITDTGHGIKKEDLHKLFGKFEQISAGNEGETRGTGLGLSICKEIILDHKGNIWAESEWGKGTTFSFTLPIE
ncbi:MAG: ATP-binding protein [Candidatus Firestonebacteria bacterium]